MCKNRQLDVLHLNVVKPFINIFLLRLSFYVLLKISTSCLQGSNSFNMLYHIMIVQSLFLLHLVLEPKVEERDRLTVSFKSCQFCIALLLDINSGVQIS